MQKQVIIFKLFFVATALVLALCITQVAKGEPSYTEYTNAVRVVREYRKAHPPKRVIAPNSQKKARRPGEFKAFNLKGEKRYNPITKKFYVQPPKKAVKK